LKILHTSDWHLGRGLHKYDLHEEQREAVNFIVDQAIERKVAAIVISGDVYDRPLPPVASIRILQEAIERLDGAGITTVITAGNHDSADRLAVYSNILRGSVRIIGSIREVDQPVVLRSGDDELRVYGIPFLFPQIASPILSELTGRDVPLSHDGVIGAAMELVRNDLAGADSKSVRSVVMAHAFVTQYSGSSKTAADQKNGAAPSLTAEVSDSERDISIGGLQTAAADLFSGVTYAALGHLHGQQFVRAKKDKKLVLRYSGSPIAYSISESTQRKSFTIADLDFASEFSESKIEIVDIPQRRLVVQLVDDLDNLVSGKYAQHADDYVDIVVTDDVIRPDAFQKLTDYFSRFLRKDDRPKNILAGDDYEKRVDIRDAAVTPIDVVNSFYVKIMNSELTKKQIEVIQRALEELAVEDATK
jgi:exonuclease SbcD